jgi:hypothetical protein
MDLKQKQQKIFIEWLINLDKTQQTLINFYKKRAQNRKNQPKYL